MNPRLSEERRARFRAAGEVRSVKPGEVLFREGEEYDFFVIESGTVVHVQGYGVENRVFAVEGPHQFAGELNLLTGGPALVTAVVRDAGEVLRVPRARLAEIAAEDEELADLLLRTFLARRWIAIGLGVGLKLVGSRFASDTQRMRGSWSGAGASCVIPPMPSLRRSSVCVLGVRLVRCAIC
jgi:thioredoxin reductase (NADPH)